METLADFIFLDSKITLDGDFSHETKRRLLLGRKVMTKLDSVLESRDITLLTKVCIVKAMVCPVVMYRCESFHFWCWGARYSWILWISQVLLEYAAVTNSPWVSLVCNNTGLFLAFFPCAAWVGCSSCLRHANLLAEGKRTMAKSYDCL